MRSDSSLVRCAAKKYWDMSIAPTDEEYSQYDGMHCSVIWNQLSDEWRCAVCSRNKREILIWGERLGSNARIYGKIGFKASIHKHHDHGSESGYGSFPNTYICGACNNLDARLKKHVMAKRDFSFSPEEMKACLLAVRPNEGIKASDIDIAVARQLYAKFLYKSVF